MGGGGWGAETPIYEAVAPLHDKPLQQPCRTVNELQNCSATVDIVYTSVEHALPLAASSLKATCAHTASDEFQRRSRRTVSVVVPGMVPHLVEA